MNKEELQQLIDEQEDLKLEFKKKFYKLTKNDYIVTG